MRGRLIHETWGCMPYGRMAFQALCSRSGRNEKNCSQAQNKVFFFLRQRVPFWQVTFLIKLFRDQFNRSSPSKGIHARGGSCAEALHTNIWLRGSSACAQKGPFWIFDKYCKYSLHCQSNRAGPLAFKDPPRQNQNPKHVLRLDIQGLVNRHGYNCSICENKALKRSFPHFIYRSLRTGLSSIGQLK